MATMSDMLVRDGSGWYAYHLNDRVGMMESWRSEKETVLTSLFGMLNKCMYGCLEAS